MSLACVGSTRSVLATLGLPPLTGAFPSTLLRLPAALYGAGPALPAVPVFGYSTKARTRLGLRFVPSPAGAAQAAQSLTGALSRVLCTFSPPRAQHQFPRAPVGACTLCLFLGAGLYPRPSRRMSTIQNLMKSLVRNWEPVCSVVGGAVSGAKSTPFPSPLSPASSGGWAHLPPASSSLELLSPFVLRTSAVCLGWLVFSLSLAIPQFKLLSHVSSLRLPSGHSGPVLTLSNAARSSLFHPHLLVADAGVWGTFLLGVAFRHVICGFYLFFPPS